MNIHDLLQKAHRLPRKQLSELNHPPDAQLCHTQRHRRSESRAKFSIVKINKNKLPLDFFPKKEAFVRRELSQKLLIPLQLTEPVRLQRKIDSQRKRYSPEKTSFFGSQQDVESQPTLKINKSAHCLNRKFQTREELKREIYTLEPTRKTNTAAKTHKNQLLDIYSSKYDPHMHQLLTASFKTHNIRSPSKKNISSKQCQNCLQDPQNPTEGQCCLMCRQGESQVLVKGVTDGGNVSMQCLDMTFYNAKSSCLPPIVRTSCKQV